MIQDLDESIKKLLVQKVPLDELSIDITFEIPANEWAAAVTKPTVNCFLYDIRENRELRSNERYLTRNTQTASENRAPARIDLTYLISVWTNSVADEHQLLGSLLKTLLRFPVLPQEILQGEMASQPILPHAWIAFGDHTPNVWDFWGSFNGRLKASISYVVTIAVNTADSVDMSLVTQKVININEPFTR